MTDLGNFFRLLADRIDANGGALPTDVLQAFGAPIQPQNLRRQKSTPKPKRRDPLDERIDAILRKKFF